MTQLNQTYPRDYVLSTEQADLVAKINEGLRKGNAAIIKLDHARHVLRRIRDGQGFGTGDRGYMIQQYERIAAEALENLND